MLELHEIREMLLDDDAPVVRAVYQAALFAERHDSRVLAKWTENELTGYAPGADMPGYRAASQVKARTLGPILRTAGALLASNDYALYEPRAPLAFYETFVYSRLKFVYIERDSALQSNMRESQIMNQARSWHYLLPREYVRSIVLGARRRLLLQVVIGLEGFDRRATAQGRMATDQFVQTTIYAMGDVALEDNSVNVQGNAAQVSGGRGNRTVQRDGSVNVSSPISDSIQKLLRASAHIEGEEAAAIQALAERVAAEASTESPDVKRVNGLLSTIATLAVGVGTTGPAVIDAVQAVQRAIGS